MPHTRTVCVPSVVNCYTHTARWWCWAAFLIRSWVVFHHQSVSQLFTETESRRLHAASTQRNLSSFTVQFRLTTCLICAASRFHFNFVADAWERVQAINTTRRHTRTMGNSKTKPEPSSKDSEPPTNSLSYASVPFQLQIRNCLRNVRGNSENSFTEIYPDQPSTSTRKSKTSSNSHTHFYFCLINSLLFLLCFCCSSAGQGPSVYTIDIGDGQMPSNYLNAGYSISETGSKTSHPNDGLPSYEEAVGKVAPRVVVPPVPAAPINPVAAPPPPPTTTTASEISETDRGHRHRRHRRHRHHRDRDEVDSSESHPDDRRRSRRRGFRLRRHLAKMGRNQPDHNHQWIHMRHILGEKIASVGFQWPHAAAVVNDTKFSLNTILREDYKQ